MPINPINSSLGANLSRDLAPNNAGSQASESSASKTSLAAIQGSKELKKLDKSGNSLDFLNHLKEKVVGKEPKPSMEQLKSRVSEIGLKGKALLEHPHRSMVEDYLSSVKDLLKDVSKHGFESKNKGEIFERVDVVDKKLTKLADQLLSSQGRELDLVNSLGELQGLLVDIFV